MNRTDDNPIDTHPSPIAFKCSLYLAIAASTSESQLGWTWLQYTTDSSLPDRQTEQTDPAAWASSRSCLSAHQGPAPSGPFICVCQAWDDTNTRHMQADRSGGKSTQLSYLSKSKETWMENDSRASRVAQRSKILYRSARGVTTHPGLMLYLAHCSLATPCGWPGTCRLTSVVRWTVFPLAHWCGWLTV
jgi:hypothetical protein